MVHLVAGRRLRLVAGLWALAELLVFVAVASWIGLGWTIVVAVATSVLGWLLLAQQGMRALAELRERARTRQGAGRALGDAGLVGIGGLLMVLPGFLGDLLGLLCLLPGTRGPVRALLTRFVVGRLPEGLRGPVRVASARAPEVADHDPSHYPLGEEPRAVEGEVVDGPWTPRR